MLKKETTQVTKDIQKQKDYSGRHSTAECFNNDKIQYSKIKLKCFFVYKFTFEIKGYTHCFCDSFATEVVLI